MFSPPTLCTFLPVLYLNVPAPDSLRYTLPILLLAVTVSRLFWCIISIMQYNSQLIIPSSPFYIFPSLPLFFKGKNPPQSPHLPSPLHYLKKHSKPIFHWIPPASQLWLSALWKVSPEVHWKRMSKRKLLQVYSIFWLYGKPKPKSYQLSYQTIIMYSNTSSDLIFNFD